MHSQVNVYLVLISYKFTNKPFSFKLISKRAVVEFRPNACELIL